MTTLAGEGEGTPSDLGFDAMAEVDRKFRGRLEVDDVEWESGGAGVVEPEGERGLGFGRGVALPFPCVPCPLCVDGDLVDFGDSGCASF